MFFLWGEGDGDDILSPFPGTTGCLGRMKPPTSWHSFFHCAPPPLHPQLRFQCSSLSQFHCNNSLANNCNSLPSFVLHNCPEQLNVVVGEEGSKRGGGVHQRLTSLTLKSWQQTSRGPSGLPRNPSEFANGLNSPSLSLDPLLPSFSYPSSFQSSTPIPLLSQLVNLFLVSLKKENQIYQLTGISTYICYLLSCCNRYAVYTPKQWQPLHFGANLITSQEISCCNSLPFLLHQQFPPSSKSISSAANIHHLKKRKEKTSLTFTLFFSHHPITCSPSQLNTLKRFAYASVSSFHLSFSLFF